MAYEYENDVISELEQMGVDYESNGYFNMSIEVEEVYRKAKAFNEIVIETTGAIMNCPPGAVETEAGRITLYIIEKYDLEDE